MSTPGAATSGTTYSAGQCSPALSPQADCVSIVSPEENSATLSFEATAPLAKFG